ncbi:threonine ammonia-lyase [Halorussus salinisoli]|uniref:threonine ammonia-lyase n=1 Tax=Halorussus salinisoli TaxID=2558242 RepID=UPI0010C1FD68|nr:pyridoxal-phosphate dependent enzyme [Halorussus salinisoli]
MSDRTFKPIESPDSTTVFPYHDLTPPTLSQIYRMRALMQSHLPRSPLVRSDILSERLDADVYLKREDTLPTGTFKVRGGIALGHDLDERFREQGLIVASTGNLGQGVAYGGREFDVPVVIGVPEGANPSKVAAMERLGARVEQRGTDFDEAREWVESRAVDEGYRLVSPGNDRNLLAGIATAGLEVVEDRSDVDVLVNPIGSGSSATGYCLTVGKLCDADVIGVQSEDASAVYEAWKGGHLKSKESVSTFAEGLATRVPFALTMQVLREDLTDIVLVSDEALRQTIRLLLEEEHILAEGAGVASVAGALQLGDELRGKTVVLPISGRNIDAETLAAVLE